jgi:cytochrome c-type biogenesis protein CcmF
MIPELGQFALILAFCLSALLAVIPLYGATVNNELWMNYAKTVGSRTIFLRSVQFYLFRLRFCAR